MFGLDPEVLVFWVTVGAAVSGVMAVASLVALPWLVARLPADYFVATPLDRGKLRGNEWLALAGRNAAGGVLLALGVIMCFTPGQGLLTILMGIVLLDVSWKHRFERRLVRVRGVATGLNWLRAKAGREPFRFLDA